MARGHATAAVVEERYLSVPELADYSGLSERTLRRHLYDARHPLPALRIGGRVLVRRSDYDRWAELVGRPVEEGEPASRSTSRQRIRDLAEATAKRIRASRGEKD